MFVCLSSQFITSVWWLSNFTMSKNGACLRGLPTNMKKKNRGTSAKCIYHSKATIAATIAEIYGRNIGHLTQYSPNVCPFDWEKPLAFVFIIPFTSKCVRRSKKQWNLVASSLVNSIYKVQSRVWFQNAFLKWQPHHSEWSEQYNLPWDTAAVGKLSVVQVCHIEAEVFKRKFMMFHCLSKRVPRV